MTGKLKRFCYDKFIDCPDAIDWIVGRDCFRHVRHRRRRYHRSGFDLPGQVFPACRYRPSLAILLPPVGLWAVLEYYRYGNVDLKAALIVAIAFMVGGWLGAHLANHISGHLLKLLFGIFVLGIGGYLVFDAVKSMA